MSVSSVGQVCGASFGTRNLPWLRCTSRLRRCHNARGCKLKHLDTQTTCQVAQVNIPLLLTETTATRADASFPSLSPVDITLTFPDTGVKAALPWIMVMSGALCYTEDYSFLLHQLASKGYMVAIVDQIHSMEHMTIPKGSAAKLGDRESLCPDGTWSAPTASVFNDVYTILSAIVHNTACNIVDDLKDLIAEHQEAIQSLNLQSVVMLGHSFGGEVTADMALGASTRPSMTQCAEYCHVRDSDGTNIIKGCLIFEGWTQRGFLNRQNLVVPDGMFLSLVASQNSPCAPYTAMTFQQTSGTWYEYVQLKSGNHFAINDWNPESAPHQVAPRGAGRLVNVSSTFTTQAEQEARLVFFADLTDALVHAHLLTDPTAATAMLKDVSNSKFVSSAHFSPAWHQAWQKHDLKPES